ncbi:hypothetical protein VYU27_005617 [Nannochloropsis oceanica]
MGNCIPQANLTKKNLLSLRGGSRSTDIDDGCGSATSTVLMSSPETSCCAGIHLPSCLGQSPSDIIAKAAQSLAKEKEKQRKDRGGGKEVENERGKGARDPARAWKEWGLVRPRKERVELHYSLGRKLGEGHTAVVRECIDKRDGKRYALKIFTKSRLSLVDVGGMLEEVSILWHLQHPNVIRFHDVLEDEWHYYLVTEFMAGGELFDRITQKSTYTEKEARDLFTTLVSTIDYLHAQGVVHRDLKPENLLLTDDFNDVHIKIADFGYAVRVKGNSLRSQCGTPCYVAPEILKKEPYGKPVDMWSIGVITFILLAGYAPFYDEDQVKLFTKIKTAHFKFELDTWEHISPEAKDLIRRLLCADPSARLTPAEALAHPWVLADDDLLRGKSLEGTKAALVRFNARRKFRASVQTVIMANKLLAIARERTLSRRKEESLQGEGEQGEEESKEERIRQPVQ